MTEQQEHTPDFLEGHAARVAGTPRDKNPRARETEEFHEWDWGWNTAEHEATDPQSETSPPPAAPSGSKKGKAAKQESTPQA